MKIINVVAHKNGDLLHEISCDDDHLLVLEARDFIEVNLLQQTSINTWIYPHISLNETIEVGLLLEALIDDAQYGRLVRLIINMVKHLRQSFMAGPLNVYMHNDTFPTVAKHSLCATIVCIQGICKKYSGSYSYVYHSPLTVNVQVQVTKLWKFAKALARTYVIFSLWESNDSILHKDIKKISQLDLNGSNLGMSPLSLPMQEASGSGGL